MNQKAHKRTLILGIGNVLLSDEGVGVKTLEYMQTHYYKPKDTEYLDGGTLSFTLSAVIESATHLIVFDAAQFHKPAGTVHCLEGSKMDEFLARGGRSVHEVGLIDLLNIARLVEQLPQHRALIGVQPSIITWGEELSETVALAVPQAARLANELLQTWNITERLAPHNNKMALS